MFLLFLLAHVLHACSWWASGSRPHWLPGNARWLALCCCVQCWANINLCCLGWWARRRSLEDTLLSFCFEMRTCKAVFAAHKSSFLKLGFPPAWTSLRLRLRVTRIKRSLETRDLSRWTSHDVSTQRFAMCWKTWSMLEPILKRQTLGWRIHKLKEKLESSERAGECFGETLQQCRVRSDSRMTCDRSDSL